MWDPEPFQACTFTPSTPIGSSFWTQGSHRLHVRSGRPGLNSLCGPAMFRDPLRFLQGAQVLNCKELTCYVYLLTLLHQMQEDAKLCWGHIISTGTKKDTLKPKTGVITFWKLAPWNLMSFGVHLGDWIFRSKTTIYIHISVVIIFFLTPLDTALESNANDLYGNSLMAKGVLLYALLGHIMMSVMSWPICGLWPCSVTWTYEKQLLLTDTYSQHAQARV